MFRLSAFALGLSAVALATAAQAADYQGYPEIRGAYEPQCCDAPYDDPLGFEVSLRYVYSKGSFRMTDGTGSYEADDTSHIVELNGLITDSSTSTYLKANAGLAAKIEGTYETPTSGGQQQMQGGKLGYIGADFGYHPLASEGYSAGIFGGYRYQNESVDMDAGSDNNLEMHLLRLGISGQAQFSDMIGLRAEAAAVPFAKIGGDFNSYSTGNARMDGNLYGAEAEASVNVKTGNSIMVELGGRVSYLEGQATIDDGTPSNTNSLSFTRYGVFGGVGGHF